MTTQRIATAATLIPLFSTPRRYGLLARIDRARALIAQRRTLAELPIERLDDLGLTREDALREASRPFWDAPRNWRA